MTVREFLKKLGLARSNGVYYIGGSDVLPPPLKGEEEQQTLEALERGEVDCVFPANLSAYDRSCNI